MDQIAVDYQFNSRGAVHEADVVSLANSIRCDGLQSPVAVFPATDPKNPNIKYKLMYGFRRHKAFEVNKATTIPAFIRDVPEASVQRLNNLTENLERLNLNTVQEAYALEWFFNSGWPDHLIADRFNKNVIWSRARRALLKIPKELHPYIGATNIGDKQIIKISTLSRDDQYKMVAQYKDRTLNLEAWGLGNRKKMPSEQAQMPKYTIKRKPTSKELEEVKLFFYDTFGPSIVTRLLAFADGYASMEETWKDIKEYCESQGTDFVAPTDLISRLAEGDADLE
jgi:ParB/RepB/Spo0J family partition protein